MRAATSSRNAIWLSGLITLMAMAWVLPTSRSSMICFWVAAAPSWGRLYWSSTSTSSAALRAPASQIVQNSAGLLETKATLGRAPALAPPPVADGLPGLDDSPPQPATARQTTETQRAKEARLRMTTPGRGAGDPTNEGSRARISRFSRIAPAVAIQRGNRGWECFFLEDFGETRKHALTLAEVVGDGRRQELD